MLERVPDGKYSLLLVSCWEYCQSAFLPIMTAGFVHSGNNAGYLVRLFIMALTSAICILWFYVDLQMFSQMNVVGGSLL